MRRRAVVLTFAGLAALLYGAARVLVRTPPSRAYAATIGDVRTVISAEAAYQSANGGWYDKPECLMVPADCIPGYAGPSFIDASILRPERNRYLRTFHPGPAVPAEVRERDGASASSIESWAYVAVPTHPGDGLRGLCGDMQGIVCYTPSGGMPRVERGRCVVTPDSWWLRYGKRAPDSCFRRE